MEKLTYVFLIKSHSQFISIHFQVSGEGETVNVKEDGNEEECTNEHNVLMHRRAELNRDLAELNGRLENAEAYRKQLMQSSDSWDSIKMKYEVSKVKSHSEM